MPSFISKCFNKRAQKRNPSFELLRLYSTLLVIMRHIRFFVYRVPPGDEEYMPVMFLQSLTSICDNEFILLSGYFGCKRQLKVSRFIPILLQNWTYSVGLYLFAVYIGWSKFTWIDFGKQCLPITFTVYWFTAPFIISQIIFDPIYRGLQHLNRNYHMLLNLVTCYVGTLACFGLGEHITIWADGTTINLFFMFLIYGSYLRFYDIKPSFTVCLVGTIVFSALHFYGIVGYFSDYFSHDSFFDVILKTDCIFAPIVSLASIFVFLLFQRIPISGFIGKVINFMSDFNYGIYTSHCHNHIIFHIMRQFFPTIREHRKHLWLYLIRDSVIIYCGCFIVELLRSMIFNFFIFNRNWYAVLCNKIDEKFSFNEEQIIREQFIPDDNLMEPVTEEETINSRENLELKPELLVDSQP